jgi:hypothetical protein
VADVLLLGPAVLGREEVPPAPETAAVADVVLPGPADREEVPPAPETAGSETTSFFEMQRMGAGCRDGTRCRGASGDPPMLRWCCICREDRGRLVEPAVREDSMAVLPALAVPPSLLSTPPWGAPGCPGSM